ncbi:hypothetical protein, partial [uncultured Duncaniella sp.]|uniref:hypothetical protein n=1 Tax=uncultured Duncaniella sp. TaxID=2768039 RepID=UPI0026147B60
AHTPLLIGYSDDFAHIFGISAMLTSGRWRVMAISLQSNQKSSDNQCRGVTKRVKMLKTF